MNIIKFLATAFFSKTQPVPAFEHLAKYFMKNEMLRNLKNLKVKNTVPNYNLQKQWSPEPVLKMESFCGSYKSP